VKRPTDAKRRAELLADVSAFFSNTLEVHGPTPRGVDWSSGAVQERMFESALQVCSEPPYSLLHYGCGYGALYAYLRARNMPVSYIGFDISPAMIESAKRSYPDGCFVVDPSVLVPQDFCIASGIFNKKFCDDAPWFEYVKDCLRHMRRLARFGVAFNMLTKHSDPDKKRTDLYYADPDEVVAFCAAEIGSDISISTNPDMPHQFTVLVRF